MKIVVIGCGADSAYLHTALLAANKQIVEVVTNEDDWGKSIEYAKSRPLINNTLPHIQTHDFDYPMTIEPNYITGKRLPRKKPQH